MNLILIGPLFMLLYKTVNLSFENKTSIEQAYPPRFKINPFETFNLGSSLHNLKELFGSSIILMIFPVWTTSGDGHRFKVQ